MCNLGPFWLFIVNMLHLLPLLHLWLQREKWGFFLSPLLTYYLLPRPRFVNAIGSTHCDDACASATPHTGGRHVGEWEGGGSSFLVTLSESHFIIVFFSYETRNKIGSFHFSGILPKSQNFYYKFSSFLIFWRKKYHPTFSVFLFVSFYCHGVHAHWNLSSLQ